MAGYYDEITGEFVPVAEEVLGPGGEGFETATDNDLSGWTYSNGVWGTPTGELYDMRYLNTGDSGSFDLGKFIKGLFPGSGGTGGTGSGGFNAGNLAGMIGLASLVNKMFGSDGGGGGYQGSIPKLTATRTMLPIPQTVTTPTGEVVPRRPGSGGITYFTPMVYSSAAPSPAPETAAGTPTTDPSRDSPGAAAGGIMGVAQRYNLGGYSDGGRLLKGPGDGVSDDIPATIGNRQPARLADGEFVIPARIVSELGNGSTEAGARKLYAMMDRVKRARMKSRKNIAVDSKADKHLPA